MTGARWNGGLLGEEQATSVIEAERVIEKYGECKKRLMKRKSYKQSEDEGEGQILSR